jgi:3-deoxy-7-phosphoheptulonate synthase
MISFFNLPSYRQEAGQFAKPRNEPNEVIDGVPLPSYQGDNVNGEEFTPEDCRNDPHRMVEAYFQSTQTLNIFAPLQHGGIR